MALTHHHRVISRRDYLRTSAVLAALATGRVMGITSAANATPNLSAKAGGFRAPLESDPHEMTFMQWPSRAGIYGGQRELQSVQSTITVIAKAIAKFEPVTVLAHPQHTAAAAKTLGADIAVWDIATEDLW